MQSAFLFSIKQEHAFFFFYQLIWTINEICIWELGWAQKGNRKCFLLLSFFPVNMCRLYIFITKIIKSVSWYNLNHVLENIVTWFKLSTEPVIPSHVLKNIVSWLNVSTKPVIKFYHVSLTNQNSVSLSLWCVWTFFFLSSFF